MMQGIRNTSNDTFSRLLGNGIKYQIPQYQRDYSWTNEQWSDLLYDIETAVKENDSHYMGYLVLQTMDNKTHQVIDGQQRLTTICIFILAIIKCLDESGKNEEEKEANKKRADIIRERYIGNIDTITLVTENKLTLNKNNDAFYKNYIVPLRTFPGRGLSASEKLMKNAFETFYKHIKDTYKEGGELAAFTDKLVDMLFFTVITVSDELNAFKVFETLNARGVQLSSSDLLKNYLFSVADEGGAHISEINHIEEIWSKIIDILKDIQVSEYLRIYWNSTHKTVRKNELYKTIRTEIKSREKVFTLLHDLREQADIFIAIQNPEDELWKDNPDIQKELRLLKLFNITQPYPLLMTAHRKISLKDFTALLKKLVIVSFRYNIICGKNPNTQEQVYNTIVQNLDKTGTFEINLITPIYISDAEFEQSFAYAEFTSSTRNKKIARYILARIENFCTGACIDEDSYTLEHILPESPDPAVWNWEEKGTEKYTDRLGNMTLLEGRKNNKIGNASFGDKKRIYADSTVLLTRDIGASDIEEWNEEEINKRQKKLAEKAKGIWKIDSL